MKEITQYNEKYRPQFHFTPDENWLNDPNGLVYYKGEYHLFYQYNPFDKVWGPMHWGHAVSNDLVHWQHLPIALEPDEELGMIFSGSAVVDKNDSTGFFNGGSGLVAVYTSHLDTDNGPIEQQSIAYSRDRGRTWVKYKDNPVIKNYGVKDFRDPKVFWHQQTKKWIMIIACDDRVRFYNSKNLKKWEYLSEFGSEIGVHGGVWECPDLIKLEVETEHLNSKSQTEKKWILAVGDSHGRKTGVLTQYFLGEFDGERFSSDYKRSFVIDHGPDIYALQSWSNLPENRKIWIGWMNNIAYMNKIPTDPWRGMMSLPRELALKKDNGKIKLIQKPIRELINLRENIYHDNDLRVSEEMNIYIEEESYEINTVIEFEKVDEFSFFLLQNNNQQTKITYNVRDSKIIVDRSSSGNTDFSENFIDCQEIEWFVKNKRLEVDIFVDKSSLEIFIDGGELTISNLVFPEKKSEKISLKTKGGSIKVRSFELYKMNSIWG